MLIEKPNIGKMAKVPISDTGTASSGISVARQPCRNREDHDNNQHDRFPERVHDLFHALGDGQRRIERDRVVEPLRETLLEIRHLRLDLGGDRQRVRTRRLVDADDDGRLAVIGSNLLVVQRAGAQMRATSLSRTSDPSAFWRTMTLPNSSVLMRRPGARTAYVNCCPFGAGSPPICPAGFTAPCC